MKKRVFILTLLLSLALSAAGCGHASGGDVNDTGSKNEDVKNDAEQVTPDDDAGSEEGMSGTEVIPLEVLTDSESVYLVYSDRSIKKVATNDEYGYSYAKLIDGLLYVERYIKDDNTYALCVMDEDGNILDTILSGYNAYNMSVAKVEDSIYVSYSDYRDGGYVCCAFVYDPEDCSLAEDTLMSDAMQYLSDNGYSFVGRSSSLITSLEKFGEALVTLDGTLYALDINDYSIKYQYAYLDETYQFGYVDAVFDDYAIYHHMPDYYSPTSYYILNIKTKEVIPMIEIDPDASLTILDGGDGIVFFGFWESFDNKTAYVYTYDVSAMETGRIYFATTPPGSGEYYVGCGTTGATYVDGRLYVEDVKDARVVWAYYDVASGTYEYTDNVVHEYSYAKYGTVSVTEDRQYYEGTDELNYFYILEDFRLNDSIKKHDVINADLEKVYQEYYDRALSDMENMKSEPYDDGWSYYCSLERTLGDIEEIGSHYLKINFNLYDYGGGAHGYGWTDHLMYDLDTGEYVSLPMLAGIDADTYKGVVADRSMEVWKNDWNAGFYTDYEDSTEAEINGMYQSFYDGANMSTDTVEFFEDHIILYYPPYEYGPYASGYIEVPIGYEELGIDIK